MTCRLCGINKNLRNFFSSFGNVDIQRFKVYILLATGVQIKEDDIVSKKVCQDCCELLEKTYQYRTNAIANNFLLNQKVIKLTQEVQKEVEPLEIISTVSMHPSVEKLYQDYPDLIIPNTLYTDDIAPSIVLDRCDSKEWLLKNDILVIEYPSDEEISPYNSSSHMDLEIKDEQIEVLVYSSSDELDLPLKHSDLKENVAIKEDITAFENCDSDQDSSLGSLIIKRKPNCDYEVINCIRDDQTVPLLNDAIDSSTKEGPNQVVNSDEETCESVFDDKPQKKKRKYSKKRVSEYICKCCCNSYGSKSALKTHERNHLHCKFCKRVIFDNKDLEIHDKCNNRTNCNKSTCENIKNCADKPSTNAIATKLHETNGYVTVTPLKERDKCNNRVSLNNKNKCSEAGENIENHTIEPSTTSVANEARGYVTVKSLKELCGDSSNSVPNLQETPNTMFQIPPFQEWPNYQTPSFNHPNYPAPNGNIIVNQTNIFPSYDQQSPVSPYRSPVYNPPNMYEPAIPFQRLVTRKQYEDMLRRKYAERFLSGGNFVVNSSSNGFGNVHPSNFMPNNMPNQMYYPPNYVNHHNDNYHNMYMAEAGGINK